MNVGKLGTPLEFWLETTIPNSSGGTTAVNTHVATLFGYVKPMKGIRALQASQIIGGNPFEVVVRHPGFEITTNYKIKVMDKDLIIYSVVDSFLQAKQVEIIAFAKEKL
jgi:SPP1 family predicted phage head-tail adaptor